MNCTCPKCAADTQVDLELATDTGTSTACAECKTAFWVVKESFARRAARRAGKIYCERCGAELGPHIVCDGCGAMFPEYVGLQLAKPGARRRAKKAAFASRDGVSSASNLANLVAAAASKGLFGTVVAVILALSVAVGGFFYYQHTVEQKFLKRYVLALFYVKSGIDVGFSKCAETSAAWKKSMESGQNIVPTVAPLFQSDLARVKQDFDKVMQNMAEPPKKFAKSKDGLMKLDAVCGKIIPIASSPSGSLASYNDMVSKLDGEYKEALKEFKATLAPEISEEIGKSKKKYKGLEDF